MSAGLQPLGRCEALVRRQFYWQSPPRYSGCLNNAYHRKTIGFQLYALCGQHARMPSERLRLVQPAHAGGGASGVPWTATPPAGTTGLRSLLFDKFCRDARHYAFGMGPQGHHYAIRVPAGPMLTSDDTANLFELYEAAIAKTEEEKA